MTNVGKAVLIVVLAQAAGVAAADPPGRSFFADRRAYDRGQVLTVVITESASVATRARTETSKKEAATGSALDVHGDVDKVSADFDTSFSGGGQIERSGRLLATLTVTVDDIDEVGNLAVSGEQVIVMNNEEQHIRVSGVVRPEDIGPDNTVSSRRIGRARIELVGEGLLARKQRPGLISRLLQLFGW